MTAIAINPNQTCEQPLHRTARVNWRVEDIIGGDKQLDFTRRFLPEALARVDEITCLNAAAQHTTLDTLMVEQLVQRLEPAEIEAGVEDFFKLIEFLNGGLMMQAQLDLESLSRAIRRTLTETEQQQINVVQERSYRWTFVGSGLTHPQFMETFNRVSPARQARLSKMAEAYCQ